MCLVSYGFWQRELGGVAIRDRPHRSRSTNGPYVVVGVLPRDFTIARQEDIFRPLGGFLQPGSSLLGRGNHNGLAAIGRLAPGATVESARAELATIAAELAKEYPETNTGQSATARPLFEVLVSNARPMLDGAARRRARDAAHRLRESRQPAARPIERPRTGDRRPPRAWRRGVAHRPATADRERAAWAHGRRRRACCWPGPDSAPC